MKSRQFVSLDRVGRLVRIVRKKYEALKLGDDVDIDYLEYIKGHIERGLKLGRT